MPHFSEKEYIILLKMGRPSKVFMKKSDSYLMKLLEERTMVHRNLLLNVVKQFEHDDLVKN